MADGHDQGQEIRGAGESTAPFTREVLDELLADLSIDDQPSSVDDLARELD
ncbi:MAG: hypothetical protein L0G99_01060 [Propionibacteriales bacterium]|nr:hypothetical protein [Propionibacteriales bacterium]